MTTTTTHTFDAARLAAGWLSVAAVSGDDKDAPALHKSVHLEAFATGVRLVATDGIVLLRSWVPTLDADGTPSAAEPTLDEAPTASAVARDPHGRGKGFLAHLYQLCADDDAEGIEVTVELGVPDDDTDDTLAGFAATCVTIEHPDHERLKLPTYEGAYPNWRKVWSNLTAKRTDAIALNPDILARVAKAAKWNPGPLLWWFGGSDKPARIAYDQSPVALTGVVMPIRWDFDLDQPRDTDGE